MKKTLLFMVAVLMAFTVYSQDQKGAVIEFQEKEKNFGDISQGEKVEHVFVFKNTGDAPLKIQNVAVTCGCTAPNWPKDAIAPGASGELKVVYNSAGKMGTQNPIIRIYSNASEPIEKVALKVNVLPKGQ
ncbi:DUF1573 domain-containing protein [Aquiflexum sp. TKW24L]|uniref:DUF1573 domain-containing protein n=1 Tax=Aquiflexum sp. TKW24L TaxID=2942212 RepID=UPI0020BFA280|nr:DUF1573 domain-containing protein [Aquiflexum sp. TKW24L]MCL6259945.1 DUF1573 domain-containing protein [Aquiflexum sp. TKW24L]